MLDAGASRLLYNRRQGDISLISSMCASFVEAFEIIKTIKMAVGKCLKYSMIFPSSESPSLSRISLLLGVFQMKFGLA